LKQQGVPPPAGALVVPAAMPAFGLISSLALLVTSLRI
jgi:hypothetical protein